ncbi:sodium:proton exchanger [bacterium]|nr:sodium:proton exchanger [bacterium]
MEFSILNLLFVLLAAWLAGLVVSRLGYPSMFGELAAGIILGPPLLGLLQGSEALSVLAEVGVLLMMLYIGMEVDPEELFQASWGGFLAAIGGFITPFVLSYLVVTWFGGSVPAGLFVGIAAGVTSLATKSRILVDLNLLDTRIAHVMMAGALIADTLSLVVFAAIIGLFEAGSFQITELALVGARAILFFGVAFFIGQKVFPVLWQWLTRRGLTGRTFNATLVLLIALFFAELAELAGLHAILGAFLAGLFLREGIVLTPSLSQDLNKVVHDISIGFLAPVFFVTAGFSITLEVFRTELPLLLAIVGVAIVGKIIGTAIFYLPTGNGWREGLAVGAGMNGRGAVEIIIAEIGLTMGLISQEIFSILVFMAIFTTALVPVMLKWSVDWLRRNDQLVRPKERQGTVIVGAGPTARELARALKSNGAVWLIDSNPDHCDIAAAEGLNVVCGDVLDEETLRSAHAQQAMWFLALTPNSEVNILAAQMVRDLFKVPEIHVRIPQHKERSLHTVLDSLKVNVLPEDTHNLQSWDHWLTQNTVTHRQFTVEEETDPQALLSRLAQDEGEILPLTAIQDGQHVPFMTVTSLTPGNEIMTIIRSARRRTLDAGADNVGAPGLP